MSSNVLLYPIARSFFCSHPNKDDGIYFLYTLCLKTNLLLKRKILKSISQYKKREKEEKESEFGEKLATISLETTAGFPVLDFDKRQNDFSQYIGNFRKGNSRWFLPTGYS